MLFHEISFSEDRLLEESSNDPTKSPRGGETDLAETLYPVTPLFGPPATGRSLDTVDKESSHGPSGGPEVSTA